MAYQKFSTDYRAETVLKDGSRIVLRLLSKGDTETCLDFISRMGEHAKYLYLRHSPQNVTREDIARYCSVDYHNSFTLVAEVTQSGRPTIVATGRYNRLPGRDVAEVNFLVSESFRNRGISTKLVEHLANIARENGILAFAANMLPENEEMMNVFTGYGFHVEREIVDGELRVTFPIAPTAEVSARTLERERRATITSVRALFYPHSVAVVGASRKEGSLGQLLLQCILESRFTGVVYPVNPNAEAIMSMKSYPTVLDIPDDVDLAIIAVPAPAVLQVVDECGRKGVRSLIIISDGFKEIGGEGIEREQKLREIALGYGIRVVGPNCMGVINTDPIVRLNGTFSHVFPPAGNIAFLSQSGALGLAILEYTGRLNIGLSYFISIGNRIDISANDLLEYWEEDKATEAILLYLESFGNPRKFRHIAKRVSAVKPIIAIKGGRTSAGSKAAATHTGAMAASAVTIEALFQQVGIIRVDALQQAFGVVSMVSKQPVPHGNRLAIVTNGGGPGIIAADACPSHGIELPEFSPEVIDQLKSVSKRTININNPLDLTASAGEKEFGESLQILARDQGNDAVLMISIPPVQVDPGQVKRILRQAMPLFKQQNKPLIACFIGQPGTDSYHDIGDIPVFTFPEEAVAALGHVVEYGRWLQKPKGEIRHFSDIEREKARTMIEKEMTRSAQRPFWLSTMKANELLNHYGIRTVDTAFARTASQAARKASELGFPVVVKLASATIAHKTEVGGIILDVRTKEGVKQAFNGIREKLVHDSREGEMEGVVLQRMIKGGVETISGVAEDPSFGPLMMFGMGGVYTEVLRDIAVRLHPLTDVLAREMIDSIKMAALLKGWRGAPPTDVKALEEMLLRLSALVEDISQIMEIDLNPVAAMAEGKGYFVLDAKIRLR